MGKADVPDAIQDHRLVDILESRELERVEGKLVHVFADHHRPLVRLDAGQAEIFAGEAFDMAGIKTPGG